jgi:hypothetical protein
MNFDIRGVRTDKAHRCVAAKADLRSTNSSENSRSQLPGVKAMFLQQDKSASSPIKLWKQQREDLRA